MPGEPLIRLTPVTGGDSLLRDGAADTNYSTITSLYISGAEASGGIRRSVVKFPLDSIKTAADDIAFAKLVLITHTGTYWSGSVDPEIGCYKITADWTTSQVTWNSRKTAMAWTSAGGDFDETPVATLTVGVTAAAETISDQTHIFDITDTLKAWLSGAADNYGLLIKFTDESMDSTNDVIGEYAAADRKDYWYDWPCHPFLWIETKRQRPIRLSPATAGNYDAWTTFFETLGGYETALVSAMQPAALPGHVRYPPMDCVNHYAAPDSTNAVYSWVMNEGVSAGMKIAEVQLNARCGYSSGSSTTITMGVRIDSTDYWASAKTITAKWGDSTLGGATAVARFLKNPATDAPWDADAVNGLEVIAKGPTNLALGRLYVAVCPPEDLTPLVAAL